MSAQKKKPAIPQPKSLPKRQNKEEQAFIDRAGNMDSNNSINIDVNNSIYKEEPPIKVMFTLPPEQADELSVLQKELRSLVGRDHRGKINRSVIVRAALRMFQEDFEKKRDKSQAYSYIDFYIY